MDFDAIDRDYCYDGPLGAQYSKDKTVFRVWAPCAEDAVLKLYPDCVTWDPSLVCPMKNNNGVWEAEAEGDLHGVYYSYTITYNGVSRETIDTPDLRESTDTEEWCLIFPEQILRVGEIARG